MDDACILIPAALRSQGLNDEQVRKDFCAYHETLMFLTTLGGVRKGVSMIQACLATEGGDADVSICLTLINDTG